jgi:hypothetical protein
VSSIDVVCGFEQLMEPSLLQVFSQHTAHVRREGQFAVAICTSATPSTNPVLYRLMPAFIQVFTLLKQQNRTGKKKAEKIRAIDEGDDEHPT